MLVRCDMDTAEAQTEDDDEQFHDVLMDAAQHIPANLDLSRRTDDTIVTTPAARLYDKLFIIPGWMVYSCIAIFIFLFSATFFELKVSSTVDHNIDQALATATAQR